MSIPATIELNLNRNFNRSILNLLEDLSSAYHGNKNLRNIIKAFRDFGTAEIGYSTKIAREALEVIDEIYKDPEIQEQLKLNTGFLNTRKDLNDLVDFLEEIAPVFTKYKVK